jgi:hypothetical protein
VPLRRQAGKKIKNSVAKNILSVRIRLPNEIVVALISSGLNVYPVKSLLPLFLWGELLVVARLFNRDEIFVAFISSGFNFEEQRSVFNQGAANLTGVAKNI